MEFNTGIRKEIEIVGYERRKGKSKNGNEYDFTTFYYTEEFNTDGEREVNGYRAGEFNLTGENAGRLREIIDNEGNIGATVRGTFGDDYKFRVTSISTD